MGYTTGNANHLIKFLLDAFEPANVGRLETHWTQLAFTIVQSTTIVQLQLREHSRVRSLLHVQYCPKRQLSLVVDVLYVASAACNRSDQTIQG